MYEQHADRDMITILLLLVSIQPLAKFRRRAVSTRAVRRRRRAAAADNLLTPPPPIVTDRRVAADRMSASRRRRFRDVFTSCCTPAICCQLSVMLFYNEA